MVANFPIQPGSSLFTLNVRKKMIPGTWAGIAGFSLVGTLLSWGLYSYKTEELGVPENNVKILKYIGWTGIVIATVALFIFAIKIFH